MPAGKLHDECCKVVALYFIQKSPDFRVDADLPKEVLSNAPLIGTIENKPINGFKPDVFAFNERTNEIVIGEVETAESLHTRHSYEQIESLIIHTNKKPFCTFCLGVPLFSMEEAAQYIRNIFLRNKMDSNPVTILGIAGDKVIKEFCLKL